MSGLFHGRWRRRVSLLASGVLVGAGRRAARRHLETCAVCRGEHAELRRVLALVEDDPVRRAEAPLPAAAMAARVRAGLESGKRPAPRFAVRRPAVLLGAAAALVLAAVMLPRMRPGAAPVELPPRAVVSGEMLDRMERTLRREQAVRYLNDAGAVLVTVATQGHDCDHDPERVDVEAETSRSRELLQRRALLLELDADEVATARLLIEDVENVLLEVASLEGCARSGDLDRISERITRRRLLMKIDLMARELQG